MSGSSKGPVQFVPPQITIRPDDRTCALTEEQYLYIRDLALAKTGILLGINKKTMIQTRLSRRVRTLKLGTCENYIEYLKTHEHEIDHFINALTTNKTDLFRENFHFDYLKEHYLAPLAKSRGLTDSGQTIHIWSAACSAGDEVYTLAMVMDEFVSFQKGFDYRILGSDIDTDILKKAENGIYPDDVLTKIPSQYVKKYFKKLGGENSQIIPSLKSKLKFRHHNLVDEAKSFPLKFDVIFLRNVLIYFPRPVIQKVIDKIDRHLKQGGLLFIGHSETLNGITHNFRSLGAAIYQKK